MHLLYIFALIGCLSNASAFQSRPFKQKYFARNVSVPLCNESFDDVEFQTLLIENGTIFVGATNAILQFNDDLSVLLRQFNTGPADDDTSCFAPLFCSDITVLCSEGSQCSNNYNTLLLAYRDRLLACGTLYETCDLLMLDNITERFGNELDLQCPSSTIIRKVPQITRRNRTLPVVATLYVDNSQVDDDLLYLGRSPDPIDVLIAPSNTENNYFSIVDSAAEYSTENFRSNSKEMVYHLAWTDDEYAYILWTNETNNQLKLSRYCHKITSTFSRTEVEDDGNRVQLHQGLRTYTEITLQCNSNGNLATEMVEAKVAFNTLYVLFRNKSNNVAKICSSTVQSLNENFDFIRSQCWNSTNSENVANPIPSPTSCIPQIDFSNEWVTCGFPYEYIRFLSPVEGVQPYVMDLELDEKFFNKTSTTFAISKANGLFSAFMGTSEGSVFKVNLNGTEPQTLAEEIDTNQPTPILNILVSGENSDTLHALTKAAIYRTNTSNCKQYTSCDECIESRDVYCGWCVLASSCTERNSCLQNQSADGWIFPLSSTGRCPRIRNLQPSTISFEEEQSIPEGKNVTLQVGVIT